MLHSTVATVTRMYISTIMQTELKSPSEWLLALLLGVLWIAT